MKEVSQEIIEKAMSIYKNKSEVTHFIIKSGGNIEFIPKHPESEKNNK